MTQAPKHSPYDTDICFTISLSQEATDFNNGDELIAYLPRTRDVTQAELRIFLENAASNGCDPDQFYITQWDTSEKGEDGTNPIVMQTDGESWLCDEQLNNPVDLVHFPALKACVNYDDFNFGRLFFVDKDMLLPGRVALDCSKTCTSEAEKVRKMHFLKFVETACNSHYKLVETLEKVLSDCKAAYTQVIEMQTLPRVEGMPTPTECRVRAEQLENKMEEIQDVIALAKGESN